MSGERLAQLAVKSTIDYLDTNLATYLTAVETARGLAAGALPVPVDILGADLPDYGGATPIIEVFEIDGQEQPQAGASGHMWIFKLGLVATHACDADIEAGHQVVRDYTTALVDAFRATAGQTLSGKVSRAFVMGVSFASSRGGNAKHLIHVALDLQVRLFDA